MDQTDHKYAPLKKRYLAWLIDTFLLHGLLAIICLMIALMSSTAEDLFDGLLWAAWYLFCVQWLVTYAYYIYTYIQDGASIGKKIVGLEIQRCDSDRRTLKNGMLRFVVGYAVSGIFWGLGFWSVIKDPKKQGFHDHIANTVVIDHQKPLQNGIVALIILIGLHIVLIGATFSLLNQKGLITQMAADFQQTFMKKEEIKKPIEPMLLEVTPYQRMPSKTRPGFQTY